MRKAGKVGDKAGSMDVSGREMKALSEVSPKIICGRFAELGEMQDPICTSKEGRTLGVLCQWPVGSQGMGQGAGEATTVGAGRRSRQGSDRLD